MRFEEITSQQAIEAQVASGIPRPYAEVGLQFLAASITAPPHVSHTVEQVTRRPARSF